MTDCSVKSVSNTKDDSNEYIPNKVQIISMFLELRRMFAYMSPEQREEYNRKDFYNTKKDNVNAEFNIHYRNTRLTWELMSIYDKNQYRNDNFVEPDSVVGKIIFNPDNE